MRVWCLVYVGDSSDVECFTTRELAVRGFMKAIHAFDTWNPRASYRDQGEPEPMDRLAVAAWFEDHGSWTYDDDLYYFLTETELCDE